ncbi:MAG: hypothetical protein DRI94_05055 [Bacteroidetes bacterium]|nr:MAG: hypothetical protein DRI94_05055 [Bacteroidota bacterium]
MKINYQICQNCRLCVQVCPSKILSVNENKQTYFKEERKHICLECGHCMAVCSTQAITVNSMTYEKDFEQIPENNINYPEFINFLKTRRSVREFKNKPVEKEKLQQIIEAISTAPFGAENDGISISIITEKSVIKKSLPLMSKFYRDLKKWFKNPMIRYIIKKKEGIETFNTIKNHLMPMINLNHYDLSSYNAITRDAPAIIIFHSKPDAEEHTEDAHICNTIAMLTAHSLGLGTTIIGLIGPAVNKFPELKDLFKIPQENKVITSIIIGYPKYKYLYSVKRNRQKVTWI